MKWIFILGFLVSCIFYTYSKVHNSHSQEKKQNISSSNNEQNKNFSDEKNNENQKNSSDISSIPESNFSISEGDIVLGNSKSKVVMIEYFSPTCPHCVSFYKNIFPKIKNKYIDTKKISYIFREFVGNKQDLDATLLARCKGKVDDYMKLKDLILLTQEKWAYSKDYRDKLTQMGILINLSEEEYKKCLESKYLMQIILNNRKLVASEPNFVGTPTFFINGEFFNKPYSFENISNAIDECLIKNNGEL